MRALASIGAPVAIVALVVLGAGCHTTPIGPVNPDLYDTRLLVFAEAGSENSDPYLSLNPESSSAKQFRAHAEATSGVSRGLAAIQGTPGTPVTFTLRPALPKTYYLNLSLPVMGVVYWTSAVSQAAGTAGRGLESAQVRIELFTGEQRIGGQTISFNAAHAAATTNALTPWIKTHFNFRSEVPALDAEKPLILKVTRISSLADFIIGTGGPLESQQSYVEFRVLPSDPLAGALYLEKGRLVTSQSTLSDAGFLQRVEEFRARGGIENSPPGLVYLPEPPRQHNDLGLAAMLGLLLLPPTLAIGGFRFASPRRIQLVLATATLLSLGFSGCLGGGAQSTVDDQGDPDAPRPTVNETYEENPELQEAGHGAIQGVVQDEFGLAVAGAHISMLATNLFTKTNKGGAFSFQNVSAGKYTMRIDAEKFLPLEQSVTVEVGRITKLNITLVYPPYKPQNDRSHLHDLWGGQSKLVIHQLEFTPLSNAWLYTDALQGAGTWTCSGILDEDGGYNQRHSYSRRQGCESPIPIDYKGIVPPGTVTVEVVLKWQTGGNAPREIGLRVVTTGNKTTDQHFLERPSGEPIRVTIFPNEADPGHQRFTVWGFWVVMPVADGFHPFGPPQWVGGRVSVTISAIKGVVPFEPAHRDFWAGAQELSVFEKAKITYSCLGCDLPEDSEFSSYRWTPPRDKFIPPGAGEIRGTMTFKHTYYPVNPVEWNLWYRTADIPPAKATGNLKKAVIESRTPDSVTFLISPAPQELDQFYMSSSNWAFYPGDDNPDYGDESPHGLLAYPTELFLTARVIRDPAWTDT